MPLVERLAVLESELQQSYRRSIACAGILRQEQSIGGAWEITGRYCGNRWCLVCARVRTSKAIQRYRPTVESWGDASLLTLTVPNVAGAELRATLRQMVSTSRAITNSMRKHDSTPLKALRKIECTYSRQRGDYHPHFHFVTETAAQGQRVLGKWLTAYPTANEEAQDLRSLDTTGLIEFFKYFTKLLTKGESGRTPMPPASLDLMFRALRRMRVYQPIGFKPAGDDEELAIDLLATSGALPLPEPVNWEWDQDCADWIHMMTGEVLTDYEPGEAIRKYLAHFLQQENDHESRE